MEGGQAVRDGVEDDESPVGGIDCHRRDERMGEVRKRLSCDESWDQEEEEECRRDVGGFIVLVNEICHLGESDVSHF